MKIGTGYVRVRLEDGRNEMQRIKGMLSKFHKKSGIRIKAIVGTSCLVIAAVLMMSLFSMESMEARAEGYVIEEDGNTKNTFWYGYTVPNGLKLWQKLNVTAKIYNGTTDTVTNTYDLNTSYNEAPKTETISLDYSREGSFQLDINSQKLSSNISSFGEDLRSIDTNTWKDTSNTDCHFTWISQYATTYSTTYYRVRKNGESVGTYWGAALLQYYKTTYRPANTAKKYASNYMITAEDTCGRDFRDLADACMKANGFQVYTSGTKIPMTQDGKPIAGVEMLTVMSRDFYYDVYRDGEGEKRLDFDIMVYTSHNYKFNYRTGQEVLNPPSVSAESGYDIASGISEADNLILTSGYASGIATPQYYLSDKKVTDYTSISWTDYTAPFSPGGKTYLYVRNNYADGTKQYMESSPKEETIKYMDSSFAVVKSNPESGKSIDVGQEITLSQTGAVGEADLFYVVNKAAAPELTRVSYAQRQSLRLDDNAGGGKYVKLNDIVYIKVNGLWYQSSDNTLVRYTGPIVTGEDLRSSNTIRLYVFVEDSGRELADFQSLSFTYQAAGQTEAPTTTVATSAAQPTTVNIGSRIGLLCSTTGSQIFYTTDGSAPAISLASGTGKPVPGNDETKLYDDSTQIIVSESIADYGKTFLIMAQAVTYKEVNENGDSKYYLIYQDSPVAKFTYKVAEQKPVEKVQSIPKTNADTPTVVQIESKIQLYSATEGATIYYTTDGSEPTFDENGPTGTTKQYSGTEPVIVTRENDSSLFTVTAVAYKENLAVSEISRMVFAYPAAVSSPYANPASGAVEENTKVTLRTATEGAVIYYTIAYGENEPEDPKDPAVSRKVFDASTPIEISQKTSIKAVAVKDTMESSVTTLTYTVSDKLNTPTPSIETGTVVASGTIISLKADEGATIHYTLDGSDPKDAANKMVQVGNQVVLNADAGKTIILRTYASKSGYSSSESGTYSYSISAYEGGIYADRESGTTVKNGDVIYLHTDMTDAKIYYTTDGSAPTTDSSSGSSVTVYGTPGDQVTITAMAVAKGSEKATSFSTFTYTFMNKLAAPTSSVPNNAVFTKESVVELKAEAGKIYYTTDGSDPTTASNLYKKSIVIDKAMDIKAIAVAEDSQQSDISSFHYGFAEQVAAPIASYSSGELEMGTKVSFTCETEGATIYYRTDGEEPDSSRKSELEIYSEPIEVNKATNFKVIAVKDQMQDSRILSVGYTVREPVVQEEAEEEVLQNMESQSTRLQSRRSFSEASGPTYTDVVLRNASYGAVVAAEEGILPENVQLVVEKASVTDAVDRRVQQVVSESYAAVASYDVTLLVNGEETQPEGTIEIGLPIPAAYENAMLYIVHVLEDGNIELYETRRSGGIAYAKVDHLSVYSIAAPVQFEEEKEAFPWLPVIYTLAVVTAGVGILLIYKSRKAKREDGMQDV